MIEAFASWQMAEGRAETLVVAGRGAARPAGGARVVFTGPIPDADLPALYSGAACFVTASRYEGFGLTALEAIACGTPVAAYDAGAVPETAGPGALLAPAGDGGGADARRRAHLRRARARARGSRTPVCGHAATFSWRRAAEQTWDVYERVARPMKVGVPIISTNEAELLRRRCLPAALAQDDVEAVVLDNASTDSTAEVAAELGVRVRALDERHSFSGR